MARKRKKSTAAPAPEPRASSSKLFAAAWRSYAVVALFAGCVQAYQLTALADDPSVSGPIIDGREYHLQAQALAADRPMPARPHFQSPLFPWALSLVYRIAGPAPYHGLFLQALLAVGIALVVLSIARRFLDPHLALVAGLGASLYGPLLFFSGQLIPAPLATFTALGALALAVRTPGAGSLLAHGLLGLVLGVAIAARGNVAPFALWLAYRPFGALPARRAWPRAAALCLGVGLGLLPVGLSNLERSGELSFATSNLGVNLWVGNNPDIAASTAARPGHRWQRILTMPRRHGVFDPHEQSAYYRRAVIDWAREHPGQLARGLLIKSSDLLAGREIPRNLNLHGDLGNTALCSVSMGENVLLYPFGLVLPLALLGLVAFGVRRVALPWRPTGPRAAALRELFWFVCLNGAGIVLFFPTSRYRLALALALLPVAVLGVRYLVQYARRQRPFELAPVLVAAAALLWANLTPTFTGPDTSDEGGLQLAWAHISAGRISEAVEVLEEEVEARPAEADAWRTLAEARGRLGDQRGAKRALQRCVKLAPGFAHALQHLGAILNAEREHAEARRVLERCVAADPGHPLAWGDLARAQIGLEDWSAAARSAARAVELSPLNGDAWLYLGLARRRLGDPGGALPALEKAVELRPDQPRPRNQLARCLLALGRDAEAREVLERAARRWPRYEQFHRLLERIATDQP
jgi:tetratricopeptide (TPR) repeat protein